MKKQEAEKTLLIGIGNSAREDDGLGWAFLGKVEKEALFEGDRLCKFQLNLEDAELISHYDKVVFVDASKSYSIKHFSFSQCIPDAGTGYSTHLLPPEGILYLCQQLYGQSPQAWTLAIKGYHWELKEGLSPKAQENMCKALSWFRCCTRLL
ncbi:MAG: hydrogenase maturation protease [Hymenobacteraceae bacterium]|nr:hydrogenase maturation protease [Hymenobacteraceae bacterium]